MLSLGLLVWGAFLLTTDKDAGDSDAAQVDTQTYRHTQRQAHRRTDTQIHRHTNTQTQKFTDTQTHRHTDTQIRRHTDTQTHRHTDTQASYPHRGHVTSELHT
eukprot:2971998-Rhodomonas_salina.1